MHATNAQGLVDDRNRALKRLSVSKRQYIGSEQRCESSNRVVAARRAEIDRNIIVDDCLGVWAAARVTALGALGLWEQFVDFFNELTGIGGQ